MIGFPCVEIFCVYAATGLSFCYLMIITFFGAFLALCGHLELSNRHSLLFTKVQSKSLSEESSWLYRLLFVGGIDPNNPSHPKDNKDEKMMAFFRTIVAPTLNHTPFKIVILLMFALYLGFSGIGIYNMKEGLQLSNLAMEDPLTQLLNRRGLENALHITLAQASRQQAPTARAHRAP